MSDTPKTDAAEFDSFELASTKYPRCVDADFARGLERERSACHKSFIYEKTRGDARWVDNERLREELQNIVNAKPSDWGDFSDQFMPWAQNRARHALIDHVV